MPMLRVLDLRNRVLAVIAAAALSCVGCNEHEGAAPQFYSAAFPCSSDARADAESVARRMAKANDLNYGAEPFSRDGVHMLLWLRAEDDEGVVVRGFEPSYQDRLKLGPSHRLYVTAHAWDVRRGPEMQRVGRELHGELLNICRRR